MLLSHILCFMAGCCFALLFKTFIDDKKNQES